MGNKQCTGKIYSGAIRPRFALTVGSMSTGKTAKMIADHYNVTRLKSSVAVFVHDAFFQPTSPHWASRNGKKITCVEYYGDDHDFSKQSEKVIMIDEYTHLTIAQTKQLYKLFLKGRAIFLYGLRNDYQGLVFPNFVQCARFATDISVLHTTCAYCKNNQAFTDWMIPFQSILRSCTHPSPINAEYRSICAPCFEKK
jgi:thymidine kinase